MIDEGYEKAKKILTANLNDLHTLAKALLEYELLSGDEIKDLLAGKPIVRDDESADKKEAPKSSVPRGGSVTGGEVPEGA